MDGFLERLQRAAAGLLRGRRGALHQPVGPRLPAGVPPAARAARGVPGGRRACLHGDGHAAGARATSSPSSRLQGPGRARRLVRPAEPHLPRAAAHRPAGPGASAPSQRHRDQAGIVYCIRRSEVDELAAALARRGLQARCRYHAGPGRRGAPRQPGRLRQRARATSWWPRSPSAWASTAPTCATSSTPACRSRSSTTSRRPAAPDATASRPSACCW